MSIRFNAVSSYLQLNQNNSRQELGQHLQQATLRTPGGVDGKYGAKTHSALQNFLANQQPAGMVSEIDFKQAANAIERGDLSSANVIQVQTFLGQKGYVLGSPKNPSGIDGIYGGKTHQALSAYEDGVSPARAFNRPDQVRLSPLASGSITLPNLSFADAAPGRSGFSRTADSIDTWFVPQFSSGSKNPRADCGPATVAMILRSNGIALNQDLGTVRREYMDVDHNNAVLSSALARGIEKGSQGRLDATVVTGNVQFRNDPQAMLQRIRSELSAGKQVILLTKNMATMKNGHYVVVQGVKDDGSIVVADPGSKARGKNRTFSYQRFVAAFNARKSEGMPNNLITVSGR